MGRRSSIPGAGRPSPSDSRQVDRAPEACRRVPSERPYDGAPVSIPCESRLDFGTTGTVSSEMMGPEAREAFLAVLLDADLRTLRTEYCRKVAVNLPTIAGWLAIDSFLGAGDISQADLHIATDNMPIPDRYAAFRGVAGVIEMAGELAAGSVALLEGELRYAAAALIRQLIEGEYLIRAFADDLLRAAEWYNASPADLRNSFMPKQMRPLGNFSAQEYWIHCDHGGHPSPHGRHLLRFAIHHPPATQELDTASSWADLAQHLRRVWAATTSLLATHHARFTTVRATEIEDVGEVERRWMNKDPLAEPIDLTLLNALAESSRENVRSGPN